MRPDEVLRLLADNDCEFEPETEAVLLRANVHRTQESAVPMSRESLSGGGQVYSHGGARGRSRASELEVELFGPILNM